MNAERITQINHGDHATQIAVVNLHPTPAWSSAERVIRTYEKRERALGYLVIALLCLTVCVTVPQVDYKLAAWAAGSCFAAIGAWTARTS